MDSYTSVWARSAGGVGRDFPWSLVRDDAGNQYAVGVFHDSLQLGGERHQAVGADGDIFIASYTPDGTYRWSHSLAGSEYTFVEHVTTAGPRIHVLGLFRGQMATDGGTIDSGPYQALLLLTYDRDGHFLSSIQVPGSGNVQGKLLVPSSDGQSLLLVGNYVGNVDFGQGLLGETSPENDFGIVAIYQGGDRPTLVWARAVAGVSVLVQGGGFAPDGSIYISGNFGARLELGPGFTSVGDQDAFVAHVDSTGAPLWITTVGSTGADNFEHVAIDATGQPVAAGWIGGMVTVAGDASNSLGGLGGSDGVVVGLDGTGKARWNQIFGGPGNDAVLALGSGDNHMVLVAGAFEGSATLAGHPYQSRGGSDAFVAAIDDTGTPSWVRRFGGTGNDAIRGVAGDPNTQTLTVAGSFGDTIKLGARTFATQGNDDVFLLEFRP